MTFGKNEKGFALIDVMIASTVFAAGFAATVQLFQYANYQSAQSQRIVLSDDANHRQQVLLENTTEPALYGVSHYSSHWQDIEHCENQP